MYFAQKLNMQLPYMTNGLYAKIAFIWRTFNFTAKKVFYTPLAHNSSICHTAFYDYSSNISIINYMKGGQ